MLGEFQCRVLLKIWVIERQGPSLLAVGAGGVVQIFYISFFLPLPPGDCSIRIELLSEKAVKSNPEEVYTRIY